MANIKSIACTVGLLLAAQTATARDLPYRTQMAAASATAGVMTQAQQILNRLPGPGRNAAFERALGQVLQLSAVGTAAKYDLVQQDNVSLAKATNWSLEVRGDGDWIRFRHDSYVTSAQNPSRPLSKALSDADAESLARKILANELAPLVTLAAGETLQAWSVANLISVIGEISTGKTAQSIMATRITLTRAINGVPVLGAGSKIAVDLANDGTLVGFDIDWSQLAASGKSTALLDVGAIRQRARQLAPASLGTSPQEVGFECGYYDTGAAYDHSGQVQPACTVVFAQGTSLHLQFAVPAGSTVIGDPTWIESATYAK